MDLKIKFARWNSETLRPFIEEVTVEVSHITCLLDNINKQALNLVKNGQDGDFVCILNEVDRIAIGVYLRQQMGANDGREVETMFTQFGKIDFYTGPVLNPILGYK